MKRKKRQQGNGGPHEAIIRPAAERLQRDELQRLDGVLDANGVLARPWKAPDTLTRMLRLGSITRSMQAAGMRFSRTFYLAGLDPMWAADLARVPVLTKTGRPSARPGGIAQALDDVLNALDACGGIQSPGGSAAWHVLGCEWTIEEWSASRSWGGHRVNPKMASGILLADLGILKNHYSRLDE